MNDLQSQDLFANRRLRVYIKIGDKQCAKGKEWCALHDGDIVSWQRYSYSLVTGNQVGGPRPGRMDRIAFGIIDMPDSQANEDMLRTAVAPVEAWEDAEQTRPDKTRWRARAGNIDTAAIATKAGDATLEARWRAKGESVEPVVVADFEATDIRDATKLTFTAVARVEDLNAVSTGSYTVGSDGGDDYSSWENAIADMANLTGDLTFTQTSDLTATAAALATENIGAYKLTFTVGDDNWHYGNSLRGYAITHTHDGQVFDLRIDGSGGTVEICRLRFVGDFTPTGYRSAILFPLTSGSVTADINHVFIDGNGKYGHGISIADAQVTGNIWGCVVHGCLYSASSTGISLGTVAAASIIEDCTAYGCDNGISAGNNAITVRRCAAYGNGSNDFYAIASATGYSNYSDDASADDANWATGSGNGTGGDPATDFDSVDSDRPDFLRPAAGRVLSSPSNTTRLASNTTDISGRAWAMYGDWIGARARPLSPEVPGGTEWKTNNSQKAIAVKLPFEGVIIDRAKCPIVLTEEMLSTEDKTKLFSNCQDDGLDIVVTTTNGIELPTQIEYINVGNEKLVLWFRADILDADQDNDFLIQFKGEGRTISFRQVWADYNDSGVDHSLVLLMSDNVNDSSPSANHGTFSGTAAVSYVDGDYGRAIDLDGIDQHVSVPHAANLAGGDGVDDNPLTIFSRVNMDDAVHFWVVGKGETNATVDYALGTQIGPVPLIICSDGAWGNFIRVIGDDPSALAGSEVTFCGTYDAGGSEAGQQIFYNGSNATTAQQNGGVYAAMDGDNDILMVGAAYYNLGVNYADGKFAHLRIIQLDIGNKAVALHQQNEMAPEGFAMAGGVVDISSNTCQARRLEKMGRL
jgi:hypothetical protein